ncbi:MULTISPECIES: hypothetical protein [Niastella]|uniref:Uncharacterized protein n=1 Tax=Niastella soli TaxID=2821487 RepID=A0ABS3Z300_9BACT|nr:hypothetical protein [Niastella soli]MBO9204548.1 hypothetical protein [Niastella soli]
MLKHLTCTLFCSALLLVIGSCHKNSGDNIKDIDSGSFLALIDDVKWHTVSGELNVLSIDSVNRKLTATFNIQFRDSVTNKTITVSNGKLNLNSWMRYGDR